MQGRRREKEGQHLFNFLSITDTLEKTSIFDLKKKKTSERKKTSSGSKGCLRSGPTSECIAVMGLLILTVKASQFRFTLT